MDLQKHTRIFNSISSIYNLFYQYQLRSYSEILDKNLSVLKLSGNNTILDIGCGTGAFAGSFAIRGYRVIGVDIAEKMIRQALKRGLNCSLENVLDGLSFPNKSFDLVTSALVAHGLDKEKRKGLFEEAARLSRGPVLFYDYSSRRNLFITFIEWLEDGDYFNFIKNGLNEMNQIFSKVDVIPVRKYNNWYICIP
jgi:ubiquinone/menaquinone biosynthesis C-methylase UbiE